MNPETPIRIVRSYPAPPEALWALWTTKQGFESWWGPRGFRADVHAIEGREGGLLHYNMVADTPEMVAAMKAMGSPSYHEVRSRFARYEPCKHLTLKNIIDFLPGVPAYESTIDVTFEAAGGETRMIVDIHPLHVPEVTRMSAEGFTSQLTKLDGRFR